MRSLSHSVHPPGVGEGGISAAVVTAVVVPSLNKLGAVLVDARVVDRVLGVPVDGTCVVDVVGLVKFVY